MRRLGRLVLLALLVGLAWKSRVTLTPRGPLSVPAPDAIDPFSPAQLRARMQHIAPILAEIVGDPIDVSSLTIRPAHAGVEARRSANRRYPDLIDVTRPDYRPERAERVLTGLRMYWFDALGIYSHDEPEVLILPETFETEFRSPVEDVRDVIVAHELVHVWQGQQFEAVMDHTAYTTAERKLARNALLEGTAEFLCLEVARELGIEPAWRELHEGRGEFQSKHAGAFDRTRYWAYSRGYEFAKAVHARWGQAGWKRLFENPPVDVWSIEQPDEWLARGTVESRDLEPWWERFAANRAPEPDASPGLGAWRSRPLKRGDLVGRFQRAGMPADAWSGCRGGLLVRGVPEAGVLAHKTVLVLAWRFPSRDAAQKVARELERAMRARSFETGLTGAMRERRDGGIALSWPRFATGSFLPTERVWAMRVQDDLVLEAAAIGAGLAPALLTLLDPERVDRPMPVQDESGWVAGEHDAVAWLEALSTPFKTELGPLLEAALASDDPDVARFALARLGSEDQRPRPVAVGVPDRIQALLASPDASMRALSLRAANALAEDVDRKVWKPLATDPSPFVRATAAGCRELFASADRFRSDEDAVVRRIAGVERTDLAWRGSSSVDDLLQPPSERRSRRLKAMIDSIAGFGSDDRAATWERRLDQLHSPDLESRSAALMYASIDHEDMPPEFVDQLPRTFDVAAMRRSAVSLLLEPDVDRERVADELTRYLGHPRWRAESLQVLTLAARRPEVVAQAEALLEANSPVVRTSAALYLSVHASADRARYERLVLDAWSDVPESLRIATLRTHVEGVLLGLRASSYSLQKAARDQAVQGREWDALLGAMDDLAPRLARDFWDDFARAVDDLDAAAMPGALEALQRHLTRWAESEQLPELDWELGWGEPDDLREHRAGAQGLLDAIDRCLVRKDAPAFRFELARLRRALEPDSAGAEVERAIGELASLRAVPRDRLEDDHVEAAGELLEGRDSIHPKILAALLRASAELGARHGWRSLDLRALLGEDASRLDVARAMLPRLLDRNTRAAARLAVDILDALPSEKFEIPPALPSWEESFADHRR
ncbi:MAG: hypothetical protein AAGD14_02260 [Planctomycetota bacterium]